MIEEGQGAQNSIPSNLYRCIIFTANNEDMFHISPEASIT